MSAGLYTQTHLIFDTDDVAEATVEVSSVSTYVRFSEHGRGLHGITISGPELPAALRVLADLVEDAEKAHAEQQDALLTEAV